MRFKLILSFFIGVIAFISLGVVYVFLTHGLQHGQFSIKSNILGQVIYSTPKDRQTFKSELEKHQLSHFSKLNISVNNSSQTYTIKKVSITFEDNYPKFTLFDEYRSHNQAIYQIDITNLDRLAEDQELVLVAGLSPRFLDSATPEEIESAMNLIIHRVLYRLSPITYTHEEYVSASKDRFIQAKNIPLLLNLFEDAQAAINDPPCNDAYNCTCSYGGSTCTLEGNSCGPIDPFTGLHRGTCGDCSHSGACDVPSPTPPPPTPYCGDNSCNNGESCSSCPRDCYCPPGGGGTTDPPPPTNNCSGNRGCNAIANCGVNGWDSADGTCSAGQVCCKEKSGNPDMPNCCYQDGWAPVSGWSSCSDLDANGWTDQYGQSAWTVGVYACDQGACSICQCQPTCSSTGPFCGSSNGCGGTCPSTDKGAPTPPTFTTPSASNQTIRTSTDSRFTISWGAASKAEYYQIQVYASHSPFTAPSGGILVADSHLTARSLTLTASHRYYGARVRALNNTCGNEYGAWSPFVYFQAAVPVTGQVFYDPTGSAHYTGLPGSRCVGDTVRLPAEAGTVSVSGSNQVGSYSDSTSFTANGQFLSPYQLRLPHTTYSSAGNNRVGISLSNPNWTCTCPAGCNYNYTLLAPQSDVNFYVSPTADAWWQVEGGPVAAFAGAGQRALSSLIPEFCIPPACNPFLIVNQNGGDSEGFVLTGGGYVSGTDQIDQSGHNWVAQMSSAPDKRQDYHYFKVLSLLPTSPKSDFIPFDPLEGTTTSLDKPDKGQDFANGDQARAYFHAGEAVIDSPWSVESDEKLVVLIDGDITIEDPITVEEGGFFMLVASGDITFDASLGTDDLNNLEAVAEGVFVADGILRVESAETGGDKRFIGEGTFVGWSGVKLERDYDNGAGRRALNNVSAVEYFRYRPDFITAAPEEFMRSRYSWQQVNP